VEGTDIMQIAGHKNVASINNYSKMSEEKHEKISRILRVGDVKIPTQVIEYNQNFLQVD
jgi:hypothetical protein